MIRFLFIAWLKSLIFTLVVEAPIFVLLARRDKVKIWLALIGGAVGTLVTHPALWFVWPHVIRDYALYIATGELIVAAVESFTFYLIARPISLKTAIAASFIANAASYGLGALIMR